MGEIVIFFKKKWWIPKLETTTMQKYLWVFYMFNFTIPIFENKRFILKLGDIWTLIAINF